MSPTDRQQLGARDDKETYRVFTTAAPPVGSVAVERYLLLPHTPPERVLELARNLSQIVPFTRQFDRVATWLDVKPETDCVVVEREYLEGISLAQIITTAPPMVAIEIWLVELLAILRDLHVTMLACGRLHPHNAIRSQADGKLRLTAICPAITPQGDLRPHDLRAVGEIAIALLTAGGTTTTWQSHAKLAEIVETLMAPSPQGYPSAAAAWLAASDLVKSSEHPKVAAQWHAQRGRVLFEMAQIAKAMAEFQQAIELAPDCAPAYIGRGSVYRVMGDLTNARADLERALEIMPEVGAAYVGRGLIACLQQEDGRSDLERGMVLLERQMPLDYHTIGQARAAAGNREAALAAYSAAIQRHPHSAISYQNRGNLQRDLGDIDAAIADYDRALAIAPDFALIYNNRGILHDERGDAVSAILDYTQAIDRAPDFAIAYNNRGNVYKDIQDYRRAIEDYDRALALQPNLTITYYNRSISKSALQDYSAAIQDLGIVISRDPQFASGYYQRALVYHASGEWLNAIADYTRALTCDSELKIVYYHRANAYLQGGNARDAITDYTQAIEHFPSEIRHRFNRALAYSRCREFDLALADCTNLLGISSDFAPAYFLRGKIYAIRGARALASSDYDRVVALAPNYLPGYFARLQLSAKSEDRELIRRDCDLILERFTANSMKDWEPLDPAQHLRHIGTIAHWLRSRIHRDSGDLSAARFDLEGAIFGDTNNPSLYAERAEIAVAEGDNYSACRDYQTAANLYLQQKNSAAYRLAIQQVDRLQHQLIPLMTQNLL
jgi:tetratricopeptide (TPR) repeat protein